jgi:polysaccharide biosynthesis transport protein
LLDSVGPREQAEENGIGEVVNFALGFLRRRYLLIIFTAALTLAASALYLRITPPAYTGEVKVLFGNPKAQLAQQEPLPADPPVDNAQLETQLQILTSKAIATSVINQLKLADDPEFQEPSRSWRSDIREWLGGTPPAGPADPTDRLVADFNKRMSAIRLGFSTVIEISFSASSAERSAEIANAIAKTYIAEQLNVKLEANRTATAWLQDRLKELSRQTLTAERAVDTFRSRNNIVGAGGKLMDDERVSDLDSRLVAARAQTSEASSLLKRAKRVIIRRLRSQEYVSIRQSCAERRCRHHRSLVRRSIFGRSRLEGPQDKSSLPAGSEDSPASSHQRNPVCGANQNAV